MKNRVIELRRRQNETLAEARQIHELATKDERSLNDDESSRWNELTAKVEQIQQDIEREERLAMFGDADADPKRKAQPSDPNIGMDDKEVRRYSLMRAIRASATNDWREAGLELEASEAVAKQLRRQPQGFFMPYDVMAAPAEKRDLIKGTDSQGGYLIGTDHMSFIDLLRNRMMVRQAGATVMTGLVGDVDIPKLTAASTAYWIDPDSGDVTESQQTLGQLALAPKTVGAFTDITRRLLIQSSPDAETLVNNDLISVVSLGLDLAALHGSGSSNQPTGVAATSGIGSVAGGTNGLAPGWSHIVSLETEVAIDNADVGRLAYMTNAKVRGKLKQTAKVSSTDSVMLWGENNTPLNGYPAWVTNQVASNLTKGTSSEVCSAIFFGNWADLVIALWSGLDVLVNPYALQTRGGVRVSVLQDADIGVRHPQSFAAMLDALTA